MKLSVCCYVFISLKITNKRRVKLATTLRVGTFTSRNFCVPKNAKFLTKTFPFDNFWKKFCGKKLLQIQNVCFRVKKYSRTAKIQEKNLSVNLHLMSFS